MSMSAEEINALNENLKQLNETMTIMVETMGSVTNQSKLTSRELGKLKTSVKDTDDAIDDLREGSVKTKGALNNLTESSKKYEKQQDAVRTATGHAIKAVTGFADALFSTEKGFTKFSGSISSAGSAVSALSVAGGPVSVIFGQIFKVGTRVVEEHLKQADAVFKARNELFKFAGAGSITSNELLDMGQAIGLTHDQLDSLIKPLRSMGPDLLTLGSSAGEGAKKFGEIGAVEEETRKRFIRMGVMPEELLETQADFIRLQRMAGMQANMRMKTDKQIQQESLLYAESLKVISEMTGLEAEEIKKRQQAVLDDFRFQAMMTQRNQQEAELRKRGDAESIAQADEMRKVTENMVKSLEIAAAFSPELAEQARSLILTGGNITEFTSRLGVAGVNTREFAEAMQRGDPDAMLHFLQDVGERVGDQAGKFGDVVGYLDDETLKMLGLTRGSMEFITKYMNDTGKSFADAYQEVAEKVGEAGTGGIDILADNQAKLITAQMELAAGFSDLLQNTNPLMQGFNSTTIAVTALAVAAGIAATALGAMGVSRGLGSVLGRRGPGSRTRTTTPRARVPRGQPGAGQFMSNTQANRMAARTAGTRIGAVGAVAGAGMSVYQGTQTDVDIRRRREEGEITTVEARRERGTNIGGTSGEVLGTAGGAVAGAKAGALLGAMTGPAAPFFIPLGGLIGAGLGAWAFGSAGRSMGEALGETIATNTASELENEIDGIEIPVARTTTPERTEDLIQQELSQLEKQLETRVGRSAASRKAEDRLQIQKLQEELNQIRSEVGEMPSQLTPEQTREEVQRAGEDTTTDGRNTEIPTTARFETTDIEQLLNTAIPTTARFETADYTQLDTAIPTTARFEQVSIDDIIKKNDTTDITNLLSLNLDKLINTNLALPRNIEVIATVPTPEQVTTQAMPEQQATATPAPQIAQNNVENNTARGLEEMTYTLASKLDRVIDLLDNGNDTQERLYRATV